MWRACGEMVEDEAGRQAGRQVAGGRTSAGAVRAGMMRKGGVSARECLPGALRACAWR